MSKRFTDTEKWDRPWFLSLPPAYKCLWEYMRDKCDRAGIWYVNFELASYLIKEQIDPETAKKLFDKQIQVLGDGSRWFIPSFCPFQYGELKDNNNAHTAILTRLRSLNLAPHKPLVSPSRGDQEKEKERKKKSLSLGRSAEEGFARFWAAYPKKKSRGDAKRAWERIKPSTEQVQRILSALDRAKTSTDWTKEAGRYVPYPASWLNAEGWEDDLVTATAENGSREFVI